MTLTMPYPTAWNLSLLYKGVDDPQIEQDMCAIEQACLAFAKKFRGKPYTETPEALLKALKAYEALQKIVSEPKPLWYFMLKSDLNSNDVEITAKIAFFRERTTTAENNITFFTLALGAIPQKEQKKFLAFPALKPHAYFLKRIFAESAHHLSEKEEQLVDLLSSTSYRAWKDLTKRALNKKTLPYKGKKEPIAVLVGLVPTLPLAQRTQLHKKLNEVFYSLADIAEAELNAVYTFKKVMDERRGFLKSYDATILGYENDTTVVEGLVSLVTKKFSIAHRFYALHAKLLGLKRLTLADRSVLLGNTRTFFDFETSVVMLRNALASLGEEYVSIFDRFIAEGHIDVYPKLGKRSGACCQGMGDLPVFVLLNHTNDVRSLQTFAHEIGHAIHTELAKTQPVLYKNYSIAPAEVASTFFELVMFDEILKHVPEKERFALLHMRASDDMATIFRQIACFNFERELHEKVRNEGFVSHEDIAYLMQANLTSYLGKSVEVSKEDGYFFVYWSHIRNFFYVYTYAYGQLISRALYEEWKKDASFVKKIHAFLSAGGSMSPEDIFKSIGIDVKDPAFFTQGLASIEQDIAELERLAKDKK